MSRELIPCIVPIDDGNRDINKNENEVTQLPLSFSQLSVHAIITVSRCQPFYCTVLTVSDPVTL